MSVVRPHCLSFMSHYQYLNVFSNSVAFNTDSGVVNHESMTAWTSFNDSNATMPPEKNDFFKTIFFS